MTRPPFGFSSSEGDEPKDEPAVDPFAALGGMPDLGAMLQQLGSMMSGESGPVNWQVARTSAMAVIGADTGTTGSDTTEVADAVRLADVWLNPVDRAAVGGQPRGGLESAPLVGGDQSRPGPSWSSRSRAGCRPRWARRCPRRCATMAAPLDGDDEPDRRPGLRRSGGSGARHARDRGGQLERHRPAARPARGGGAAARVDAARWSSGLDLPVDEVRLFVALREAAHHRLFGHVPWLRAHLLGGACLRRGHHVDTSRFEELARGVDPTDPEALQRAIGDGLFEPTSSPVQQAALARLETALALVEGWVDTSPRPPESDSLPSFAALQETMRRRRATGGPAERTFASLVGLELRPRRLREAAALWQALGERRGIDDRDAVWSHPDLLPSGDDLDDPTAWVEQDAHG